MNHPFDETGILADFEDYFRKLRQRLTELSVTPWGECEKSFFIGESPVFLNILNQLKIVAALTCPILFIGESGVGKELFTRTLYLLSARASKPFMVVNCAGFQSPSLLASELFGHKKGSFTGTDTRREGILRATNGGVVFLDEIGELSLEVHAMLLRVLETGEVRANSAVKPRFRRNYAGKKQYLHQVTNRYHNSI